MNVLFTLETSTPGHYAYSIQHQDATIAPDYFRKPFGDWDIASADCIDIFPNVIYVRGWLSSSDHDIRTVALSKLQITDVSNTLVKFNEEKL